jgi:diphosphomevalonate decarboxylase
MNYSEHYLKEIEFGNPIYEEHEGSVGWECPSNIALIKYWGKREGQLPMNPSLSFTLSNSVTKTNIRYHYNQSFDGTFLEYFFEDQVNGLFENKIANYLNTIGCYLPFLNHLKLTVRSGNTFPHSAGIASSASSFGALALCLLSIENELTGNNLKPDAFFAKASFLARLGSGSASRSIYGGIVEWGRADKPVHSSDEIATALDSKINPIFKNYQDVVLIIDNGRKTVSSSKGHSLMLENPYAHVRFDQARKNLSKLITVLEIGDLDTFISVVEIEALSLHFMMLTSIPGFFLVKQGTLDVINKVRLYREMTKTPIAFTLDAGANVHLLFPEAFTTVAIKFINKELVQYCANGRYILDKVGLGPRKLQVYESV